MTIIMKKEPLKTTYRPVNTDETVILPVLESTGIKGRKYLMLPDEYFDTERHVLLDGVTLIPMIDEYNGDK